jgi:hypothetical protein
MGHEEFWATPAKGLTGVGLAGYGIYIFFLFLILIWYGCSYFHFFCIFLRLMMCYMVIGCYKIAGLHQDLIVGALLLYIYMYIIVCYCILFKI